MILAAPEEGENLLYVWLEDGAGNRDHTAAGTVSLLYDMTGPVDGAIFINGDSDVTGSLIVMLTDLNAVDGLSGMGPGAQMRFSNGTGN